MKALVTFCSFIRKTGITFRSPFLIGILLIFPLDSYSQPTDSVRAPSFTEPLAYAIGVAGTTGGVFLLMSQDRQIQQFFSSKRNNAIDQTSKYFFSPMGNGLISLPILGLFYGVGYFKDDRRAQRTAIRGAEAYLLAAITTGVIKQLAHRHRPYQDDPPDPFQWEGPLAKISYNSFPSGHSSAIFAIATVIAGEYHETIWVPVLVYSVAGVTATYRMAVDKHWSSDVFAGSVIGIGCGIFILHHDPLAKFHLLPYTSSGPGMTLIFSFK
ncbi:MAG: phosphatase PAP2 family protein [Syntrophothermus sp.]